MFQAVMYEGHEGWVRSISVHSSGQFLASGGDDGTMRVWEISSGRCLRKIQFEEKVRRVGMSVPIFQRVEIHCFSLVSK